MFLFLIYNRTFESFLFIYLLTVSNLLEFISLFITFFIYVFKNLIYGHDINTYTFLFHSNNLETISNKNTESN